MPAPALSPDRKAFAPIFPQDLPHARVVVKCKLDASGNLKNLQVLEPGPATMTAKIMARPSQLEIPPRHPRRPARRSQRHPRLQYRHQRPLLSSDLKERSSSAHRFASVPTICYPERSRLFAPRMILAKSRDPFFSSRLTVGSSFELQMCGIRCLDLQVPAAPWKSGASALRLTLPGTGALAPALQPQPRHQRIRPSKPHPLPPSLISRHRRPLIQNLLRPLPRLIHSPLRLQKRRVVVVSLRTRGNLRRLLKKFCGLLRLPRLRVGVRQQSYSAMKVVCWICRHRPLQVRTAATKSPNQPPRLPVGRTDRSNPIAAQLTGLTLSRPCKIAIIQVKQSQLFVIPRRGLSRIARSSS